MQLKQWKIKNSIIIIKNSQLNVISALKKSWYAVKKKNKNIQQIFGNKKCFIASQKLLFDDRV